MKSLQQYIQESIDWDNKLDNDFEVTRKIWVDAMPEFKDYCQSVEEHANNDLKEELLKFCNAICGEGDEDTKKIFVKDNNVWLPAKTQLLNHETTGLGDWRTYMTWEVVYKGKNYGRIALPVNDEWYSDRWLRSNNIKKIK